MEYKSNYVGLRLNGQFPFCSFPFSLDTYQGCTHNCKYCFSYFNYLINSATKNKDFFKDCHQISYKTLEKAFELATEKDTEVMTIYKNLFKERMPVHWGGISDPFSGYEKDSTEKVSLKILKLFNKHQYPYILSTKSKWIVDNEEYMKEITENKNAVIQISLIAINNKLDKLEPGTSIDKRLELIHKLSKTNRVIVRCQPYIIGVTDDGLEDYIKKVADAGAKAMTVEFLKLTSFKSPIVLSAINKISEILGQDLVKYYKWKGVNTGTDTELRTDIKLPLILEFKKLVHKYGMEFYCADNAFRDYGDSPICCGLPLNYEGFENSFNCQSSRGLFTARANGLVYFDDVYGDLRKHEEIFLSSKIKSWLNSGTAVGHIKYDNKTFFEKAAYIWDNPSKSCNPSKFFNNLEVAGKDKNGHIIYKYIKGKGSCDGCMKGLKGCQ